MCFLGVLFCLNRAVAKIERVSIIFSAIKGMFLRFTIIVKPVSQFFLAEIFYYHELKLITSFLFPPKVC